MRTHVDEKYMLRFEKMYEIKPKHQEEWKNGRKEDDTLEICGWILDASI